MNKGIPPTARRIVNRTQGGGKGATNLQNKMSNKMSKPKLPQPLQDALDWAELESVTDEDVGMRLMNMGRFSATTQALVIVSAEYRKATKQLEAAKAYKKRLKTENNNLRQQLAKLTK